MLQVAGDRQADNEVSRDVFGGEFAGCHSGSQKLAETVKVGIAPTLEKRRQKQRLTDLVEKDAKDKVTFRTAYEEWLQSRLDSGYCSDGERSAYRVRQILNNHF